MTIRRIIGISAILSVALGLCSCDYIERFIIAFNRAETKANATEAPRVLASFESAYLAAMAEYGIGAVIKDNDLIFDPSKDSELWLYSQSSGRCFWCFF